MIPRGIFFDPGTQTGLAADGHWDILSVAVFFSIVGFIFNMILLGFVVDSVRDYMEVMPQTLSLSRSDTGIILFHEVHV